MSQAPPDSLPEPPPLNEVGLKKLAKMIKKMRITDNCVVAIQSNTTMARKDSILGLIAKLSSMNKSVVVVVVDDLKDMSVLNQTEMNKLGWFRIDALSSAIHVKTKKNGGGDVEEN